MKEIVGEIKIIEKIASGGMGDVFKASVTIPGNNTEIFAIKRLSLSDEAQFENELDLLSKIDHENVCKVFGFCKIDGIKYIVMEFIDGITLSEIMRLAAANEYLLSEDFINQVFLQLTTALNYIHTENKKKPKIIQCDLSPHNVMVTKKGVLKLIDFGIGRKLKADSDYTKTINFAGKIPYAAPEVFEQGKYSIQSDLYSLGVILFELSTNQLLFSDLSISDAIKFKTQYRVPNVRNLRKDFPEDLTKTIDALLCSTPKKRKLFNKSIDIQRDDHLIVDEIEVIKKMSIKDQTLKIPHLSNEYLLKNRSNQIKLTSSILFVVIILASFFLYKNIFSNSHTMPKSVGHKFELYEKSSAPLFDVVGCRQLGIVLLSDFDILIEGTKNIFFNGEVKRSPYVGYTEMMRSIETTINVIPSYSQICKSYEQWGQLEKTILKWHLIFQGFSIDKNMSNKEYDTLVSKFQSDFISEVRIIDRYTSQLQLDKFKFYIDVSNDFNYFPSAFESVYVFSARIDNINISKYNVADLADVLSLGYTSQWFNTQKPVIDKYFFQKIIIFFEKQNNSQIVISNTKNEIEFSSDVHGSFCIVEKSGMDLKSTISCFKDIKL